MDVVGPPPAPRALTGPSPSRSNPFARAPSLPAGSASFSRSSLLPSLASPAKTPGVCTSKRLNPFATPSVIDVPTEASGSASKGRSGWRLLWRGGLEIGHQGYRLEGATFFAQLQFPSTPGEAGFNPFDVPIAGTPAAATAAAPSPLHMRGADTDICLSLESMRGRKYLQIRNVVDLAHDELLQGDAAPGLPVTATAPAGAQVQLSIAPNSMLLITYLTNILCRDKRLSPAGRTRKAIELGLGDDTGSGNTLLIYGQAQEADPVDSTAPTPSTRPIKLMVSRRSPPPSVQPTKVRPGEPLPRAPLFFPSKAPSKAPPPFPNRDALSKSRSFQRAASVTSIYAPPPPVPPAPKPALETAAGTGSGRTPGRRGEKRKRDVDKEEDRMRRAGKIVPPRLQSTMADESGALEDTVIDGGMEVDEDIFGTRPITLNDANGAGEGSTRKRGKVPQQVLDNKAVIRKQTAAMLETRGYARQHDLFKEVFAMTTKGVYFVCRDALPHTSIKTDVVQHFVARHLDMYLPSSINDMLLGLPIDVDAAEHVEPDEQEMDVKVEQDDPIPNPNDPDPNHEGSMPHRRRTMESVIEEDEDEG